MIPLLIAFMAGVGFGVVGLIVTFRMTYERDPDEAAVDAARLDALVYGTAALIRRPDGRLERLDPAEVELRVRS